MLPRENYDAGLHAALIYAESRAMLTDRVVALRETMFFAPRIIRRLTGNICLRAIEPDDRRIADEGRRHRVDSGQTLIQIRSRRRRNRAGLLAELRLSLLPRHVRGPKPGGNERHEQEHGHDADLPPERLIAEDMHAFARF